MADLARLSSTTPISDQNSSSKDSSSTLTVTSGDEMRTQAPTGCGTCIHPSHTACQHTSDHDLPNSRCARSIMLSRENSDDEGANDATEDTNVGSRANLMDSNSGRSQDSSLRGYSRITDLPPQSRNSQSGKLLKQFRDLPDCLSEGGFQSPSKADIVKTWKWEVIICFLAVGLVGSMYFILQYYDHGRIPNWGTAINLSTLIALMATILRTMLVYVASEIIGQAKWNYLTSGRPKQTAPVRRLIETSRFNDASHGLLGAVKIIPTINRDPATLTAVIVMLVSLGTGSFVQQAIQTRPCHFSDASVYASLPIARNITIFKFDRGNRGFWGGTNFGPTFTSDIQAGLLSALAPDSEETGSPMTVVCPTGNCTFENPINGAHSTLGVCSSCADTSSLIKTTTVLEYPIDETTSTDNRIPPDTHYFSTYYILPNGMNGESIFSNSTAGPFFQQAITSVSAKAPQGLDWAGDLVSSEMKASSQWAFANISILTSNYLPTSSGYTDYIATTCTIYPCLRSYKASIKSGKLEEALLSTVPLAPNVAALFRVSPQTTNEDIQQAMREAYTGPEITDDMLEMLFDTRLQAVQSPCLVNNTIWTKGDMSSSLDTERVVLLHADADPNGALRFTIENTTAPAECIHGINFMAWALVGETMRSTFNATCMLGSFVNNSQDTTQFSCLDDYWITRFYSKEGTTATAINKRMRAFTDRLSNKMRMGLLNNPEAVFGKALQTTVCSRIEYSWLAFPAVLVAATNGLLAWTMFQTSRRRGRVMVWKTSILPLLFYSEQFVVQNAEDMSADSNESPRRDEGVREPLLDLDEMEAEARQRKVRFEAFD